MKGVIFAPRAIFQVRIRLTRKLANALNGVDLRATAVGDVVDVPAGLAGMLIEEGWAEVMAVERPSSADDRRAGSERRTRKRP